MDLDHDTEIDMFVGDSDEDTGTQTGTQVPDIDMFAEDSDEDTMTPAVNNLHAAIQNTANNNDNGARRFNLARAARVLEIMNAQTLNSEEQSAATAYNFPIFVPPQSHTQHNPRASASSSPSPSPGAFGATLGTSINAESTSSRGGSSLFTFRNSPQTSSSAATNTYRADGPHALPRSLRGGARGGFRSGTRRSPRFQSSFASPPRRQTPPQNSNYRVEMSRLRDENRTDPERLREELSELLERENIFLDPDIDPTRLTQDAGDQEMAHLVGSAARRIVSALSGSNTSAYDDRSDQRNASKVRPGAVLLYKLESASTGSDVWPDLRNPEKVPARCTPLNVDPQGRGNKSNTYTLSRTIPGLAGQRRHVKRSQIKEPWVNEHGMGWPNDRVPAEIFGQITDYLCRDDLKAMRLCSREFEHKVAGRLFETVVVPFNTEIYGMLGATQKVDIKGKKKVGDPHSYQPGYGALFWKNAKEDDTYEGHGLNVFRGFGPHIQRYGMSFEVDEDALANPPEKKTRKTHTSYWGHYEWPLEEYTRFDTVAGLEYTADETPRMKIAFSYLEKVKELALSIDSSLGWLQGPDQSLRARVLRRPSPVFGSSRPIPERRQEAQNRLWAHIEAGQKKRGNGSIKQASLYFQLIDENAYNEHLSAAQSQNSSIPLPKLYLDRRIIQEAESEEVVKTATALNGAEESDKAAKEKNVLRAAEMYLQALNDMNLSEYGILYSTSDVDPEASHPNHPIVPGHLRKAQKEWLLETEWAQRAFLASYMVAVVDNPITFQNVTSLNFTRISSRYLTALCRTDFWDALTSLKSVNLQVSADWRDVVKDEAGFVETPYIDPSSAILEFRKLLQQIIAPRKDIKTLRIGWASGGEHAQGVHARNRHLLRSPVVSPACLDEGIVNQTQLQSTMINLPFVENLTLTNCWMTPTSLRMLAELHVNTLKHLTLDSVSLNAVPTVAPNAAQVAQALQNAQQQMVNWNQIAPQFNTVHHGVNANAQQLQAVANGNLNVPNGQQLQAWLNGHMPNAQQFQAFLNGNVLNAQQFQALANGNAHGPGPAHQAANPPNANNPNAPNQPAQTVTWTGPHRAGSWPDVLDAISPGKRIDDVATEPDPWADPPEPRPYTALRRITLRSCGYAALRGQRMEQSALEPPTPWVRSAYFTKRVAALVGSMMATRDAHLGDIVQWIPDIETECMQLVWGLHEGWDLDPELRPRAVEAEFDGWKAGGTGRVSGVIEREDHRY